jgi:hypothetical protein
MHEVHDSRHTYNCGVYPKPTTKAKVFKTTNIPKLINSKCMKNTFNRSI